MKLVPYVTLLQVDEELFSTLSNKKWCEAAKFSLVCSDEVMFKKTMENMSTVNTEQYIISAGVANIGPSLCTQVPFICYIKL